MEAIELIETPVREVVKEEVRWYDALAKKIKKFGVFFLIVSVMLFGVNRCFFVLDAPIDNDAFGTFGDFVGGILGTIFTFYGTLMLIRTFQNQIESNDKAQSTNDRLLQQAITSNTLIEKQNVQQGYQLFLNQFDSFWEMYIEAVNNYEQSDGDLQGKQCLNRLLENFMAEEFKSNAVYGKRINQAVKLYEDFYAQHREHLSVHLRMLYQLLYFISNSQDIDERTKVEYAKAIRGNLTEAELIFIRYNCRCPFGKKLQPFVNEFNLLKHLPLISLFEFRKWAIMLDDNGQKTAINSVFISIRKMLCNLMLSTDTIGEDKYECGKKWRFVILYRKADNTLLIKLQKIEDATRRGTITPAIEKAFDKLELDNLEGLFTDYFRELFFYSNFCVYNNNDNVRLSHKGKRTKNNVSEVRFMFKSNYPLILSQRQIATPQAL